MILQPSNLSISFFHTHTGVHFRIPSQSQTILFLNESHIYLCKLIIIISSVSIEILEAYWHFWKLLLEKLLTISLGFKLWREIARIMIVKRTFCIRQSPRRHCTVGNPCLPRSFRVLYSRVSLWYLRCCSFLFRHPVSFYTCSIFIFPTKQAEFSHCLRRSQMSVSTKRRSDKNILNTEFFFLSFCISVALRKLQRTNKFGIPNMPWWHNYKLLKAKVELKVCLRCAPTNLYDHEIRKDLK